MLREIIWQIDSAIRGMDYAEYLEWRKQKILKELEELPDTPNFLTGIREYYGLKSYKRTTEVMLLNTLIAIGITVFSYFVNIPLWQILGMLAITQVATFALGVWLQIRFKG